MWKLSVLATLLVVALAQDEHRPVRYRYVAPGAYRHYDPYHNRGVYADPDARVRAGLNYVENETPKPYSFSYTAPEEGGVGSSSRTEVADGTGRVEGSYTLTNGEGHTRVVEYVSDEGGFRATVRTDEPGTSNQSPASVNFQSTAPSAYSYDGPHADGRTHRHPIGYRAVRPIRPVVEELANAEQPVDQPAVDQPAVVARRPIAYYPRRAYYPHYRRDIY